MQDFGLGNKHVMCKKEEITKMKELNLIDSIKKQRRDILTVAVKAKQAHLSPAFSVIEILNILYKEIMNFNAENPESGENDRFILSKGHAALALYALLSDLGVITHEQLLSYCEYDSILGEHPDRNKIPSVDISTGSLGHGLPCGVGMAAGFKAQNKLNKVYVIIGDGEANEGTIWESALVAERLKLDNLICIVDNNHSESYSPYLIEKFKAFGWNTIELYDGNNLDEIRKAFSREIIPGKPIAIVASTVKGYGASLMEKDPEGWHSRVPSMDEYALLMEELA